MNTSHPARGGTAGPRKLGFAAAARVKKLLRLAPLCAALFLSDAQSYELLLGVLTSTGTSVNQGTTAVPFTINGNLAQIAIQCDAPACVKAGAGSSTAASCTTGNANQGVLVAAGQLYDMPLAHTGGNAVDTVAAISVSGTANCVVYQVVTGP